MCIKPKIYLRFVISALALLLFISPLNAKAYSSSGVDGLFQPTASVVLDTTQPIFNFTSIFIPTGVTVSFSELSSSQPIELLATGNIDIAGTLDIGANSLWIETPGSLTFSGSLNGSVGALTMVANSINLSGVISTGGSDSPTGGGASATICINSSNYCASVFPDSSGNITIADGGTLITGGGNTISLSPVPEPGVWVMLFSGLFVSFAVYRLRNRHIQPAH